MDNNLNYQNDQAFNHPDDLGQANTQTITPAVTQNTASYPARPVKAKSRGKTVAIVLLSVALGLVALALAGILVIFFLFDGDISDFDLMETIGLLNPMEATGDDAPSILDKYYEENSPALREEADTTADTEEDTTETSEDTTREPETEEPEVDMHSTLGFWHRNGDSSGRELAIHSVDDNAIEFSLRYFHLYSIENVRASRSGNTATFYHTDGYQSISGELIFEKSKITVVITDSDFPYMSEETQVFSGRHSTTWTPETEDTAINVPPSLVVPTYTEPDPYMMIVYVIEGLNLRTGPDTSFDRILLLPQNTNVMVYGWNSDYNWAYVYDTSSMQYGWVAAQYLASL